MMDNRAINYVLTNSSIYQKPQTLRRSVGQLLGQGAHALKSLEYLSHDIIRYKSRMIGVLFAEGTLFFGITWT